MRSARRRLVSAAVVVIALVLTSSGCTSSDAEQPSKKPAPVPQQPRTECGDFKIAYDPSNGYEASAFVVGHLAQTELGCDVTYVKTTSRKAWWLVAHGRADVYLDAFGSTDLSRRLATPDGPVTILGPNGMRGGVELLTPAFMAAAGIGNVRDLADLPPELFGGVQPSITTVTPLLPLAQSLVEFQGLDFGVSDYAFTHPLAGMGDLLQAPRRADLDRNPNFFLVEGPRTFLGDGPGRHTVELPRSSASLCEPGNKATLCSVANFKYLKIANSEFARSDSPAYNLVYNYRLEAAQAATILALVELSGFDVGEPDVVSWINTHANVWKRWLERA
ncbi:MAG: hypothetical protein H0T17_06335 [Propionibacteriales bacterium]|nr:hypothetical protein [Propionibacteriales bacterium]